MDVIGPRLVNTVVLAAITAAIAVPLSIALGIVCARYRGRFIDKFLSTTTLASISIPEFFVAYIVMMLLAVKLQLFPSMAGIRASMDWGDQPEWSPATDQAPGVLVANSRPPSTGTGQPERAAAWSIVVV